MPYLSMFLGISALSFVFFFFFFLSLTWENPYLPQKDAVMFI